MERESISVELPIVRFREAETHFMVFFGETRFLNNPPGYQLDPSRSTHLAQWAQRPQPEGESFNDGDYFMYINVTDQNIVAGENANPVMTARMRYDRWKASGGH